MIYQRRVVGHAMTFTASSSRVSLGNNLGFARTDSFTVLAWVRSTSSGFRYIFSKRTDTPVGYSLAIHSSGMVDVFLGNSGTAIVKTSSGHSSLHDSRWHLVAFTYGGTSTASGVTIYVDGASVSASPGDDDLGSSAITNSAAASIGSLRGDSNGSGWGGQIGPVLVVSSALSGGTIASLYANRTWIDWAPLVTETAYYPIAATDTTSSINDASSSNFDGTPSGLASVTPVYHHELRAA